ncbi:glycerol-3-phosphate dehydrogenase SDP6, mitochondrial-like [Selaginella moellendorffii]|uniref:glycerol-3-phosphate dehydrogenase SDP6, mitochondrial-like n=1 Tax=Selaginella moellendorffii TaxID=88036 RepID=UPI000D1CE0BF|nr:glycerol-3-phosphate dehydrogenase SDP6, mitochondrial-like [Selaginella moellendorffii]|eukprot:XP_024518956.1 glycerol-3-phosphate dehydrogenase SDP6, mitochondrial-like [Selaginella moellendorffii]
MAPPAVESHWTPLLVASVLQGRFRVSTKLIHGDNSSYISLVVPTCSRCEISREGSTHWTHWTSERSSSRMLHTSVESFEFFPVSSVAKTAGDGKTLKGTVVCYDGQMDDARVNVSLACTAALAGAAVLNHAEATAIIKDGSTGQVVGARVRDNLSGMEFDVHAKVVMNAGGPFVDELRRFADKESKPMIAPSSGVHVVLPDYYSPESMGLIVPKTKDGRVVFMLP